MKMLQNSNHSEVARGLDAYFTPRAAVVALLDLEHEFIPKEVYEPAVGAGNIAQELELDGYEVYCADIRDYGYPGTVVEDYLAKDTCPPWVSGIITNPPFKHAKAFCEKAVKQVDYVAMLGRIAYLESLDRQAWLTDNPPTRILVPSRRLPMMHRLGWDGPKASSNVCHPWYIWDKNRDQGGLTELHYYDWKDYETDIPEN
jgi:hypothetical protein